LAQAFLVSTPPIGIALHCWSGFYATSFVVNCPRFIMGCISSKAKVQEPVAHAAVPDSAVEAELEQGRTEPQVVIEEETEIMTCCWSGNVMAGGSDVVTQNHQQTSGEEAEVVDEMTVDQEDVTEVAAKQDEDAQSKDDKLLVAVSEEAKDSAVEEREDEGAAVVQNPPKGQTSNQNPPDQKPKQANEGEPETQEEPELQEDSVKAEEPNQPTHALFGLCNWC